MMRKLVAAIALAACQPPAQPAAVAAAPSSPAATADACRDDIPDCAAACALRETHRNDWIDFYERRCAGVILGKNPDKIEPLEPTPYAGASDAGTAPAPAPTATEFPPQTRASFSLQPPPAPFDPSAVSRTGGSEPPECKASRMLRAQRRDREADMMRALCVAKGGDAGL